MQTEPATSPGHAARSGRLLVLTLVAATLAADAAAVCWHGLGREPLAQVVVAALASSQVGLLAIWAGLGSWANPWRFSALAAALVGWSLLLSRGETPVVSPVQWLFNAGFVIVILALHPLDGAKAREETGDGPAAEARERRRLQFSLGNLMGGVTNAAVWLGVVEYARQTHERVAGEVPWAASARFVGFSDAALALCGLWLVAGSGRLLFRLARYCVVLSFVFLYFLGMQDAPFHVAVAYFGLQGALVLGSLMVMRVAGVRILRQWSARQSAMEASPPQGA